MSSPRFSEKFSHNAHTGGYHYREDVAAGTTSSPIYTHSDLPLTVATTGAGTGTFSYTLDTYERVAAGTATWFTLDVTTPQVLEGASAVKLAAAGGTVTLILHS